MPFQHLLTDRAFQQIAKSIEGGNDMARPLVTEGVGQGVGMLDSSKSCRTVVQEFMEDFADALERMKAFAE